jgi:hypothetical protein
MYSLFMVNGMLEQLHAVLFNPANQRGSFLTGSLNVGEDQRWLVLEKGDSRFYFIALNVDLVMF